MTEFNVATRHTLAPNAKIGHGATMTAHEHTHEGDGHAHSISRDADQRTVLIALALITGFLLIEVIAAVLAHSLSLFADAGHMATDVAALGLSAWAIRLAAKPASGRWTFGLERAEILSAAINGVALAAISLLIGVEAITRLISPRPVHGGLVAAIAVVGAAVNLVAAWILAKANRTSLNLRGAYLHIVTDLYAFIGTALAGLVIVLFAWERADSIASLVVVCIMAVASWGLLRDAGRILLQAAPEDLDLANVRIHLLDVDHVIDVHDLHAWSMTSGSHTISAHVVVEDHCFATGHAPQILDALQHCLMEHFAISHATLQLEPESHLSHEADLHH